MVNSDFADFFALLNQHDVEFLIIGGVAYNFHAPPRATKDIDVWVRPTRNNLARLVGVLEAFGLPTQAIDIEDLEREQRVLMIGRVPTRPALSSQARENKLSGTDSAGKQ